MSESLSAEAALIGAHERLGVALVLVGDYDDLDQHIITPADLAALALRVQLVASSLAFLVEALHKLTATAIQSGPPIGDAGAAEVARAHLATAHAWLRVAPDAMAAARKHLALADLTPFILDAPTEEGPDA